MRLRIVERPDALLKSQETLIDFGTFQSTLPIVTLSVLGSLGTGEIYDKKFAQTFAGLVTDLDLRDGVRAGRSIIGGSLLGGSLTVPKFYNFKHFLLTLGLSFDEPAHLNLVVSVLLNR